MMMMMMMMMVMVMTMVMTMIYNSKKKEKRRKKCRGKIIIIIEKKMKPSKAEVYSHIVYIYLNIYLNSIKLFIKPGRFCLLLGLRHKRNQDMTNPTNPV